MQPDFQGSCLQRSCFQISTDCFLDGHRLQRWTQEQPAAGSNIPAGKTWANSWTSKEGDLFVFGGFGADTKIHNDMWRFTSATRTWQLVNTHPAHN